ncbi:MAG TPA: aldo/keto reductase [Microbacterium sp.]|uniref:aldo/keto reductase n=1 Tax=Microbacterium sp. TaxID=51671 RepID=UPI002BF85C0F|nr:aldo/keto reductase [Microbacterium sp.]HWI30859.1 aldo/keto reductase [Microbacterium sp.]
MTQSPGRLLAASLEPLTMGASPLGKRPEIGDALADALLSGRFHQIDTSNNYAHGNSERLLGEAIARLGGLPYDRRIFSKVDPDPETGVFDADRVLRSFDETKQRLGLDTLPLLHFHDPYGLTVAEAMAPGGPVEALARLREEGAVGAIGIAAGTRALMEAYVRTDAFDAVLIHNRFTLVDRTADQVFTDATERGMAVFNAAPFGGGILAGSATRGVKYAYTEPSPEFLAYLERLRGAAADSGVDLAAAALQFAIGDPRVHTVVVGVSSIERLQALDGLLDARIPGEFWDAVRSLGTPPPSPAD